MSPPWGFTHDTELLPACSPHPVNPQNCFPSPPPHLFLGWMGRGGHSSPGSPAVSSSFPAQAPAALTTMAQATGWYSRLSGLWICRGGGSHKRGDGGGVTDTRGPPPAWGRDGHTHTHTLTWMYLMRAVASVGSCGGIMSSAEVTKPGGLVFFGVGGGI